MIARRVIPAVSICCALTLGVANAAAQRVDSQAVALTGLPFPVKGKYRHRERIRTEYDRLTDTTRTQVSILVSDVSARHILTLAPVKYGLDVFATHPGEELLDYPRAVFLRFRFGENDVLLLDGHATESASDVTFVLDDTTRLAIRGPMPMASFLQLVNASKVEGRLLGAHFTIGTRSLEALRDFASRLNPLAPVTPE